MKRLNPEQLSVCFDKGVTLLEPITARKYTLTHSDLTAELFLNISKEFAWDKITSTRDEVLAEWKENNGQNYLQGYVYITGGEFNHATSRIRYDIFKKELPLALEAIRFGDRILFESHPNLDTAKIWIYFYSTNPAFNKLEYWGQPKDYI